ncbi:MAG: hypothetical protein O3A95_07685 [Planctomycetota bacterium]|nr:hypothetical protein [Planctomycetota bacterium]
MKRLFYPISACLVLPFAAAAALPSCGGEEASKGAQQENVVMHSPEVFREGSVRLPYEPPAEDAWAQRYIEHLRIGTKDAHHFALERLGELGPEATPFLMDALRKEAGSRSSMGFLVSLCSALSISENSEGSEVLLEILRLNQAPVVRSAAFEAISRLLPEGKELEVLELVSKETEVAPRTAGLQALAFYGNAESIAYLVQGSRDWLNSTAGDVAGESCWKALLLVDQPGAVLALQELEPRLAPFPSLQAYGIRIALGDRDVADNIRPYLDPTAYPSSGTRSLALQMLGELGDWESVLALASTTEVATQLTLIGLLRRDDAVAEGVGLGVLESLADSAEDEDVRFNALLALIERGQKNRLDPFLRLAREFPTGKGSVQAVQVLGKEGVADERTAAILIPRWPFALGEHQSSLLKALTRTGSPEAAKFLLQRVLDKEEDPKVRSVSGTILANFGEQTIPMFRQIWEQNPNLTIAKMVVPGVGRYPENPAAREFLIYLASSPEVDDRVRRATMEKIPQIFRQEGFHILMELSASEPRAEIQSFITGILSEYY